MYFVFKQSLNAAEKREGGEKRREEKSKRTVDRTATEARAPCRDSASRIKYGFMRMSSCAGTSLVNRC